MVDATGTIHHYFTMIHVNGQYYCNSAYGTDAWYTAEYTTVVDVEAFRALLHHASYEVVHHFYVTHFLATVVARVATPQYIDEHPQVPVKQGQPIPVEIEAEIRSAVGSWVGILCGYAETVEGLIAPRCNKK